MFPLPALNYFSSHGLLQGIQKPSSPKPPCGFCSMRYQAIPKDEKEPGYFPTSLTLFCHFLNKHISPWPPHKSSSQGRLFL